MKLILPPFDATVEVRDDAYVAAHRASEAAAIGNLAHALRAALDVPLDFPSLKRALTPDDRIVLVVDDRTPSLGELLREMLNYLGEAGIVPENITLLSPAGSRQPWVDDLPDAWQDVRTEIHDPTDRRRLSYLASTRHGRRVYLNRTLIDADQTVILSDCRFDPQYGYLGGAAPLFPALSDAATIQQVESVAEFGSMPDPIQPLEAETQEVAWLLGAPFLIQIVEGAGDSIAHIVGGAAESVPEVKRLCTQRWHVTVKQPAQTVVVSITGDPGRQDFTTLAEAASSAANVVEPGGRIVILSRAAPELGDGMSLLRDTDSTAVAARRVQERQPADRVTARLWLNAANKASLYLLSGLDDGVVEELFATPLQQARQVQRLVDAAGSCVFLPDAHKMLTEIKTTVHDSATKREKEHEHDYEED